MSTIADRLPHGWLRLRAAAAPAGWVAVLDEPSAIRTVWGAADTPAAAVAEGRAAGPMIALPASAQLWGEVAAAGTDIACRIADGGAWSCDEPSDRERAHAEADRTATEAHIPDAAAGHEAERRAMLRAMVMSALDGHGAVRLSGRGQPLWTAAAPLRHEVPAGEAQLSQHRHLAAAEVAANLGNDGFRRSIEDIEAANARTARLDRLAATAEAMFGPEWVAPLARQADTNIRTAQRWAARETEPRDVDQVIEMLRPAAADRARQLRRWLSRLEREFGV